jgi:hypothetical protein
MRDTRRGLKPGNLVVDRPVSMSMCVRLASHPAVVPCPDEGI